MFGWVKEIWKKEWPEMKDAPCAFVIFLIIGLGLGIVGTALVYEHVVIAGRDSQIGSLKTENESQLRKINDLQNTINQNNSENALKTKQKIRDFFKESFPPELLQKIDMGEKEIPVSISGETIMKLNELRTEPNFDNYLSFQEYPRKPSQFANLPIYTTEAPAETIKELGNNPWPHKYRLSPKPPLIEKGK